jgi:hypothetical protein
MQFESHLGHDRSPRKRRFCFNVCTKLAVASSDGLGRGLWPGRPGAYSGVWVAGPGPWLVGVPSALCGVMRFLTSGFVGVGPGGLYLFMGRGRDDDMTAARLTGGLRREVSTTQKAPCVQPK